MKKIFLSLYFQVIVAIVLGLLFGHFRPEIAVELKPLGDGFIKLIKMMIAPIIFCTIVVGIATVGDMKQVGRVGLKALVYFQCLTLISLFIGLTVVNLVQPGVGMNVDPQTLDASTISTYTDTTTKQHHSLGEFILDIIPKTVFDAFGQGNILQVLLFSLLFAFALGSYGEKGRSITESIEKISHVLFRIIHMIMYLAPIGAFGAMAFTIGKYGWGSMQQLASLILCFYAACILFVILILGSITAYCKINIFAFLKFIREEIFIVIGTSSSESALPRILKKMEIIGCPKTISGLVIPTGYSFNLDGTAIYLTMAALFLAQATNTPLSLSQQISILFVLLLTSKGAAGITGSGFIVLAATLSTVSHIPVASLALILGIDRFMSEARAVTNLIGNAVATLFISKWEGSLDLQKAHQALKGHIKKIDAEEL